MVKFKEYGDFTKVGLSFGTHAIYAIECEGGYNHKQDTPGNRVFPTTTVRFD